MKRILIVGDSHVASLLRASQTASWPVHFSFFAHASTAEAHLGHLLCLGDGLTMKNTGKPTSSIGSDSFRPREFDAIVLVGLRTELPYILWNDWGCIGGTSCRPYYHISHSAQRLALFDYISEQALSISVAKKVRLISDCRLIVIPNPYILVTLRNKPIPTAPGIVPRGMVRAESITGEAEKLEIWKAVFVDVFRPLDVNVLFQPSYTASEHIFTKREYGTGESSAPEIRHMNVTFGQVVLRQLMEYLGV